MDIKSLTVEELLKLIFPSSDVIQELKEEVLRTKNTS